jgi:hypothetical protein
METVVVTLYASSLIKVEAARYGTEFNYVPRELPFVVTAWVRRYGKV